MREVEGVATLKRDGLPQRLRAGMRVGAGELISLEPKAKATLVASDGLSLDLGSQGRFEANWTQASGGDIDLHVDAGTLGVQTAEGSAGAHLSVMLGGLRTKLQSGRFFFENGAGPTGVAIACAYEGSVTLGPDWGAAGHLQKGQCVALEGLSGAGPILLRSIAMVPEWNAPAPSAGASTGEAEHARLLPAVVEARPAAEVATDVPASRPAVSRLESSSGSTATAVAANTAESAEKRAQDPFPVATPGDVVPPRSSERWIVNVASFSDPADAKDLAERLRRGGFEVALREDLVRGSPSFRTVVSGLSNEEAARKIVERLERDYGYRNAWALRSR